MDDCSVTGAAKADRPRTAKRYDLRSGTSDCPLREKAIAALQHAEIPYQITYTSMGLLGVIAAAEAGLGITVLGQSTILKISLSWLAYLHSASSRCPSSGSLTGTTT